MRLAAIAVALVALAAPSIAAADPPAGTPPILGTLLVVDADGKSTGRPDMATVSLGVVTQASNVATATAQNAQRMTALIQSLRGAGIAERDIHTEQLTVQPQQEYHDNQRPRITGYEATNEVRVTVHDLALMGRLIDGAIAAGGNNVQSITFGFGEPKVQTDAALRDAIAEARRRADIYAQAFGMRVHRVVGISESGAINDQEVVVTGYRARSAQGAPLTPVSPGEIETNAQVHITFELR